MSAGCPIGGHHTHVVRMFAHISPQARFPRRDPQQPRHGGRFPGPSACHLPSRSQLPPGSGSPPAVDAFSGRLWACQRICTERGAMPPDSGTERKGSLNKTSPQTAPQPCTPLLPGRGTGLLLGSHVSPELDCLALPPCGQGFQAPAHLWAILSLLLCGLHPPERAAVAGSPDGAFVGILAHRGRLAARLLRQRLSLASGEGCPCVNAVLE